MIEYENLIKNQFELFNDVSLFEPIFFKNLEMIYCCIGCINEEDILNDHLLNEITWVYDDNNYRIPFKNNKKIKKIRLKNSDNIYNYISSSTLIPEDQIISGERLTSTCDIFIGENSSLYGNPNIDKYINSKENFNNIQNLDSFKIIYIKTDDINRAFKKYNLRDKIIVTHNSDKCIDHKMIRNLDIIKKQYSQNCCIYHPKLTTLPIGIQNSQWFDYSLLEKVRINKTIKKDKDIYFFFSLSTHPSRKLCFNILKNKLIWNKSLSKEEYFIELKRHKYAICPRGNGLDTHRLWECLYLDVIPIMLKSDCVNICNLPIIYIDNWFNLDMIKNYKTFNNLQMEKLTLAYYKKLIMEK